MKFLLKPFFNIRNRWRRINETLEANSLNTWPRRLLEITGALAGFIGYPLLFISVFIGIRPDLGCSPETVKALASVSFICNIWFWRFLFLFSIMLIFFSYHAHFATQLWRKIGQDAVKQYKEQHGCPWY